MVIFKSLLGNEDIKSTLGVAIKNSTFSHAYIIEGQKGSGKHTIARLASAAIMCKSTSDFPCEECLSCQKILHDNCVDVRFYNAFKVDEVRKVKETIYESTTECDYKVIVFNDADKMNPKAQNALLISLEEPPKNVIFFLLCQDAGALLETIRSRAQILRTEPLGEDIIFNHIKKTISPSISDTDLKEIIVGASGSLGYVIDMLDQGKATELIKARTAAQELVVLLLNSDTGAVNLINSMFSWQRDKIKDVLSLSLSILRDLMLIKKSNNISLCFFTSLEEARRISSPHSLKKLLSLQEAIDTAIDGLNVNASSTGILSSILAHTKKKGR
ncbi:MAG: hypothetical protein IJ437_06600 [Clostridia bacterium]|nr:hypothetical protein [Clostridia bacterium]